MSIQNLVPDTIVPDTIDAEVRVSDILELYRNEDQYGRFMFICYAVGYLLNETLNFTADHPEHLEHLEQFARPYHKICDTYGDKGMSLQINSQVFTFMRALGIDVHPVYETLGDFFLEHSGATLNEGDPVKEFKIPQWSHDFRCKLLERIVQMDPEAVFSVKFRHKKFK